MTVPNRRVSFGWADCFGIGRGTGRPGTRLAKGIWEPKDCPVLVLILQYAALGWRVTGNKIELAPIKQRSTRRAAAEAGHSNNILVQVVTPWPNAASSCCPALGARTRLRLGSPASATLPETSTDSRPTLALSLNRCGM
jgi:hypothetical protein